MEGAETISRANCGICQFCLSGLRVRRTEHAKLGGGKGHGRSAKKAATVMLSLFGHGKAFVMLSTLSTF
jgi:hypothetical protein